MLSPPFGPGSGPRIPPREAPRPATSPRAATPHQKNGMYLSSWAFPGLRASGLRTLHRPAEGPSEELPGRRPPAVGGRGFSPRQETRFPAFKEVCRRPSMSSTNQRDVEAVSCDGPFSRMSLTRTCDPHVADAEGCPLEVGARPAGLTQPPTPSGKRGCRRLSPSLEGLEVDAEGCPPRPGEAGPAGQRNPSPSPPGEPFRQFPGAAYDGRT